MADADDGDGIDDNDNDDVIFHEAEGSKGGGAHLAGFSLGAHKTPL